MVWYKGETSTGSFVQKTRNANISCRWLRVFGRARNKKFELTTKTMQGTFKFDAFDSNVVEVKSRDVQKFIKHLHYMIDSI